MRGSIHGCTPKWMVGKKTIIKWMMNRGTAILGNPHISIWSLLQPHPGLQQRCFPQGPPSTSAEAEEPLLHPGGDAVPRTFGSSNRRGKEPRNGPKKKTAFRNTLKSARKKTSDERSLWMLSPPKQEDVCFCLSKNGNNYKIL